MAIIYSSRLAEEFERLIAALRSSDSPTLADQIREDEEHRKRLRREQHKKRNALRQHKIKKRKRENKKK
jgi:hypothetical protein